MTIVWIPGQMRDLTGGAQQVTAEGSTVRQVIADLEHQFPGFRGRLLQGDRLMPHLALIVDGEESQLGLAEPVQPHSEVHFLAAMAGGEAGCRSASFRSARTILPAARSRRPTEIV